MYAVWITDVWRTVAARELTLSVWASDQVQSHVEVPVDPVNPAPDGVYGLSPVWRFNFFIRAISFGR